MNLAGRGIGWLVALVVFIVCLVLIVLSFAVATFTLTPLFVLGLIAALAVAMLV